MEYPLSSEASALFEYLEETGSTNRELLSRAAELPEFFVLAANFQTAGRGRMDRSWEAAPGSSIMASVLLRPKFLEPSGIGWLSLMTALAISQAIGDLGLSAKIKWPNDLLIGGKKVCGVLAEALPDLSCVVVGFGINVDQSAMDFSNLSATSLSAEISPSVQNDLASSASVNRDLLLATVIGNLRALYSELSSQGGDAEASGLRRQILEASATVGHQVSVEFPTGKKVFGLATDIDATGRLVVVSAGETLSVSAGDVLHLRATERED